MPKADALTPTLCGFLAFQSHALTVAVCGFPAVPKADALTVTVCGFPAVPKADTLTVTLCQLLAVPKAYALTVTVCGFAEELVKLVRQTMAQTAGSVMVFCNSSSTSFYLGHILEENGVQPAVINGEMTEKVRNTFCIQLSSVKIVIHPSSVEKRQ